MKLVPYSLLAALLLGCMDNSSNPETGMTPPVAEKKDSVLTVHGDSRVDPYFWMRLTDEQKLATDPDEQTKKVKAYLEAENAYKTTQLRHTEALQDKLYEEMVGRIKQDDETVPYFKNGYWYYTRYVTGGEYPVYCRKPKSLEAKEEVILDVNELAEGHAYYAARGLRISPNNNIVAFAEDTLSRRIYTIRFKDLKTGAFLEDEILNAEPGGAWANDNKTFFYTTKNEVTLLSEKIWRHVLGIGQDQDQLMYHEQDESYYIGVYKSKSDQYVIIYNSSTLSSDYHILNANEPQGSFVQFTPREDVHEYSISHYNDRFYIVTNWEAQNFRLMETPADATSKENWKEVIPHRESVLIRDLEVFQDHLVIGERSNALTHYQVMDMESGEKHYIQFDEAAYVLVSSQNPEFETDQFRFVYSSLTTPESVYDYNLSTRERDLKKREEVVGGHQPDDYVTERIFAEVRDGTQVPITLVYRKNVQKGPHTPLLQYAYGSYGSSMDPWFNSARLSLLDRGFIYAIAHIRGGQEMGRQWYEDGKMFKKKNTFNDFVDCSKYLINEGYTSAAHLYASGGSAGGLLMGAVVNQSPETYNGIVARVPFVDVISTMMDESIPLTTGEFDEWGNPKNLESYEYMLSYSPYDQVREQAYPNMLVTTGFFDSQVQYWEPAKWVARLREKKTDDNLLLLHTNMEAGHGGASGRFKRYRETALQYAFFLSLENILE